MHQSTVRVDGTPGAGPTAIEISQLRDQSGQHPEPRVTSTVETTKAGVFTLRRKTCSLMGVQIVGTGSYVPENVVTNAGALPPSRQRATCASRRQHGQWPLQA